MKVMREAPTLRSRRLIVTEHGIPYQARASGERSAHTSRGSNDPKGEDEKVVHRVKGHRWSDDQQPCGTRNAESQSGAEVTCRLWATGVITGERSDTETVTLRSERGDWRRAIARWYLAGRLLNLGHPFGKWTLCAR
jgi:hypothetical protein